MDIGVAIQPWVTEARDAQVLEKGEGENAVEKPWVGDEDGTHVECLESG